MLCRKVLALIVVWLVAGCVHDAAPVASAPAREVAPERPAFLWKIDKDGKSSWLFGTIHVGVDARRELPAGVWAAMNGASCFVMETDPGTVSSAELFAMSRLPRGKTLDSELTKAAWDKLTGKLGGAIPGPALQGSTPWFAAMLYLQAVAPRGAPMDGTFLAEARAQNKRVEFLEDWREAIVAFAGAVEVSDLEELVTSDAAVEKQTRELLAAYRAGDAERLRQIVTGATRGQTKAEEKMNRVLAGRNEAWLPRLEKAVAPGGCFVAVGAAHLVGNKDLLTLLKARGYTVRRVTAPAPARPGSRGAPRLAPHAG
jgi:uncharacterized protein YbaP (TraB family)